MASKESPMSPAVSVSHCKSKTHSVNYLGQIHYEYYTDVPLSKTNIQKREHAHSSHGEDSPQIHAVHHRAGAEHTGHLLTSDSI